MNNCKTKHLTTIKTIYSDVVKIRKPVVGGLVHDVYIIETKDGNKFICRFSSPEVALHNKFVSKKLIQYGINVPNISLYKCQSNEYCETYPFVNGKTLQERLTEGISTNQQDKIYHQLFDISCKISQIPCDDYDIRIPLPLTAKIIAVVCKKLNIAPIVWCHTDLVAKNIILDEQDNVAAIVDLDSVYPESIAFALINFMQSAKQYGYNIKKLLPLCASYDIQSRCINLEKQATLCLVVKKIGRFILNEPLRKQLLKIKVK